MEKDFNFIIRQFGYFLLKCFIPLVALGLLFLDVVFFGTVNENSFVEFGQEAFVLATFVIFFYLACSQKANGLLFVAGFFLCVLIRELDCYFDLLFHGAWKYFAVPSAVFFVYKALSNGKEKALSTLAGYMQSPSFTTMSFGVMVVFLFSRVIGMGSLWRIIMHPNYNRVIKTVVEEGTELFGYSIIFLAAVEYAYSVLKKKD